MATRISVVLLDYVCQYETRGARLAILQSLQDDLDKLVKWSEKWQMVFNFGKCKCIHIGHGNMDEKYTIGDAVLGRTTQEKDLVLGVTFSVDMKVSEQCCFERKSNSMAN